MPYAIDYNLLSQVKAVVLSDPNNADLVGALAEVEVNPLVSSQIWTKADLLAASRKLIQGDNPRNAVGTWFNRNLPFGEKAREIAERELRS